MRGVILVSGGLDSLVLHDWLEAQGHDLVTVRFFYGSRHDTAEARAAADLYPLLSTAALMLPGGGSALMRTDVPLPSGYDEQAKRQTVVPFRNGVLLAYAVAYAEAIGAQRVWYGAHAGDRSTYPDCRPAFIRSLSCAARLGTYGKVEVEAPFAKLTKTAIVRLGARLGQRCIDRMRSSWSCYAGGDRPCGWCGTCVERSAAFRLAGVEDR